MARLRNPDAIELLSIVIEHLVKGEIMQLKNTDSGSALKDIEYYLTKSFYKTASLIANSCKACAVLAGMLPSFCLVLFWFWFLFMFWSHLSPLAHTDLKSDVQELAFEFGKHIGLTFQVGAGFAWCGVSFRLKLGLQGGRRFARLFRT